MAYGDGSGLDDVVAGIEKERVALAVAPGWTLSPPLVMNQKTAGIGTRPSESGRFLASFPRSDRECRYPPFAGDGGVRRLVTVPAIPMPQHAG